MYLFISMPVFIVNLIFTSMALYDIWYHYEYTTFKPRLILVATIMLSNVPASFTYAFTDTINKGFLMNSTLCYFYVMISNFYMLKFFALLALTVFIGLIIFTNYNIAKLNKIGWWLNLIVLSLFLFHQFILVFLSGWKQVEFDKDFNDMKHPKRCILASKLHTCIRYLSITCTVVALTAAVIFLIQNVRTNKMKKGTSSYRISLSFFFIAIINLFGMTAWFIEKLRGKALVRPAKWVALDLGKLMPAGFALVYLFTEAWGRLSHVSFGVKRILKVIKCRRLFKLYLSDIDAKKSYELVCKWEKLNSGQVESMDVLDRSDMNKEEAQRYIEKNLELELYGFLSTEAFNDFNLTYNFGGQIEADLAEEIELQNVDAIKTPHFKFYEITNVCYQNSINNVFNVDSLNI